MTTDRRTAVDHHGVRIGTVRADGEVETDGGVHIGAADADGAVRDFGGVHIGAAPVQDARR